MLDRLKAVPQSAVGHDFAEFNILGRAWIINVRPPGNPHDDIEATVQPVGPALLLETMSIPGLASRIRGPRHGAECHSHGVNEVRATLFRPGGLLGRIAGRRASPWTTTIARPITASWASWRTRDTTFSQAASTCGASRSQPAAIGPQCTLHGSPADRGGARRPGWREDAPRGRSVPRERRHDAQAAAVGEICCAIRLLALPCPGFFAVVGLVLAAAVGTITASPSYSVGQRTREIGIRVALGARQFGVGPAIRGADRPA